MLQNKIAVVLHTNKNNVGRRVTVNITKICSNKTCSAK